MKIDTNISQLLEPISADSPTGESLRYDDIYDKIREARRDEDDKLPQGVWKSEVKKADWDHVERLCKDALQKRSKDVQISAWLTEAWLHIEGVGGLTKGLELILELTKTFWDTIHPQMTDGNFELRTVPYEWINTRLSEEVPSVHITMPSARTLLPYHLLDYNEANRIAISGKKDQGSGQEKPSLAKISLSIDQTPTAFYRYMDESCTKSLTIIAELEGILRHYLEGDAPSFYRLREKIDAVQRFATHILGERGEKLEAKKPVVEPKAKIQPSKKVDLGQIETREQAYAILGDVAAFLEKIEPHSPTPYLIRRSITWGDMTLSQVFADAMKNGRDMSLIIDLLDVKKEGEQ